MATTMYCILYIIVVTNHDDMIYVLFFLNIHKPCLLFYMRINTKKKWLLAICQWVWICFGVSLHRIYIRKFDRKGWNGKKIWNRCLEGWKVFTWYYRYRRNTKVHLINDKTDVRGFCLCYSILLLCICFCCCWFTSWVDDEKAKTNFLFSEIICKIYIKFRRPSGYSRFLFF